MSLMTLCARVAVAAPFLVQGWDAATAPENHRERAALFAPILEKAGLKLDEAASDLSSRGLGAAYLAGGAALAAGILPRAAAAGLAAAHVPVSIANYPIFRHEGAQARRDAIGLAQGAAMIGGAILAAKATRAGL